MNERSDINRVLTQWFDDGPTVMPDRVVDVVADRITHQRQRPAWLPDRRSFAMNNIARTVAAMAAVILVAVVGWNLLPGNRPGIGGPSPSPTGISTPPPSTTPSPRPTPSAAASAVAGAFDSKSFEFPLSLTKVESWIVAADRRSDVDLQRGDVDAGIFSYRFVTLPGPTATDPRVPVPADFAGWLAKQPEFGPATAQAVTIGGRAGMQFDVDLLWTASSVKHPLLQYGAQIWWFDDLSAGARGRFIALPGEGGGGILIHMEAQGATFDAAGASFDKLLETLTFR